MSSVKVRAATVAAQPAISQIHYEALKTYHDFYAAFLATHPRELIPMATKKALEDPEVLFLLAEEGTEAVGFVRYYVVERKEDNADGKAREQSNDETPSGPSMFAPKEHMKDLWERFNERDAEMDACYENATKGRRHYYVKHLMVHPSHQRKGVGRQLLQAVIDKADAEGVPTLLVASAEGHNLYLRLGFEDLGRWTIDNAYWAEEIVRHERQLGIGGNEGLEEKFKGMKEEEAYMVRWPGR